MSYVDRRQVTWAKNNPFQVLPRTDWAAQRPTYRDAEPAVIECCTGPVAAPAQRQLVQLRRERPTSGTSRYGATVGGVEIVAWRDRRANCTSARPNARTWAPTCRPERWTAAR